MKNFRLLLTSSLFLLMCAMATMAQSVQTDYDRNFNLGRLKTYTFAQQERGANDPLAASPINERRIHDALDLQLSSNGLVQSSQSDFVISYFVTTARKLDIQDNRLGLFNRMGSIDVNQVTEGTIVVIFVDRASNQEVWRGYVSGAINPKDLDKDVNKGITKLVQKFKKNQEGKKMRNPVIRRLMLGLGVATMALAAVVTPAQTDPRVAQQKNAAELRKYEWKSRTEIRKDGDTKKDQVSLMSYDMEGTLQQTTIGSMPEKDLPSLGLRGAIAQKKKKEFIEKLDDLKVLAKSYGELPPEKMKQFMATATKTPEPGLIRIEGGNILHTGDAMIIWINPVTKRQRRVEIVTSMDDKIVHIVTEFHDISDTGPTYVARNQINYNGNAIVILTENFDYTLSHAFTASQR